MILKLVPPKLENAYNIIDVTKIVEEILKHIAEEADPEDFASFEELEIKIESVQAVDDPTVDLIEPSSITTPITDSTTTCFALKTDPSIPNALGDAIKLFKDGQTVGIALGYHQAINELCIEDTTDGDAFKFQNGGQDNVSLRKDQLDKILFDLIHIE